ncbi:helix-turn-helix domain-containing protein, partial [Aliarcobacter butzleri]
EKQIDESSIFRYKLDNNTIYNFRSKELIQDITNIKLTSLEIIIFEYLLDKKNQIVSKEELLHILNKDDYYDDVSLKNIIYRLKKKFNSNSLIINQKNIGYMLKI